MSDETYPFTTYERVETCRRVEVTLDNLPALAQHFGGEAVYRVDPDARHFQKSKPRLVIPADGVHFREDHTVEVGAWVDAKGCRWNPEPLTQGWHYEGTYMRAEMTP